MGRSLKDIEFTKLDDKAYVADGCIVEQKMLDGSWIVKTSRRSEHGGHYWESVSDDDKPTHVRCFKTPEAAMEFAECFGFEPVPGDKGKFVVFYRANGEVNGVRSNGPKNPLGIARDYLSYGLYGSDVLTDPANHEEVQAMAAVAIPRRQAA